MKYTCEFCNKEFNTLGNYRKHIKYKHILSEEDQMTSCLYCGQSYHINGIKYHEEHCALNPSSKKFQKIQEEVDKKEMQKNNYYTIRCCEFCGRECQNLNSYRNHVRLCKQNPNHQILKSHRNPSSIRGASSWSCGLSKENSELIRLKAEALHQKYVDGDLIGHQKGKPRTEEEKRKISETMKANPKAGGLREGSGRGKKGKYKGYYCDSTYELVYIIYNIDHNIKFERCTFSYEYSYQGQIHRYFPDFILEDGYLIEIKGYLTDKVLIKLQAVTDRDIKLLLEKDLKYAFDYVKSHYKYKKLTDLYDK